MGYTVADSFAGTCDNGDFTGLVGDIGEGELCVRWGELFSQTSQVLGQRGLRGANVGGHFAGFCSIDVGVGLMMANYCTSCGWEGKTTESRCDHSSIRK